MSKGTSTGNFYKNSLKGFNAKILLEHLFKKAGYETYLFGYESLFSRITSGINRDGNQTSTLQRIRSMPDLFIINNNKKEVYLIEAKFTGYPNITSYFLHKEKIDWYIKYWNDSIIVVVIPAEEYIYAKEVSKIETNNREKYYKFKKYCYKFDLEKEFVPIYKIFPEISKEKIDEIKGIINNLKSQTSSFVNKEIK